MLMTDELARWLGLSSATVYRLAAAEVLPSVKVGGSLRFDETRIEDLAAHDERLAEAQQRARAVGRDLAKHHAKIGELRRRKIDAHSATTSSLPPRSASRSTRPRPRSSTSRNVKQARSWPNRPVIAPKWISLSNDLRPETRRKQQPPESRGYGPRHRELRGRVQRLVRSGRAKCARCGKPIAPDGPWDLDHADDRNGYLGPAHRRCNRGAAAAKTNRERAAALRASRSAPAPDRESGRPRGVTVWSRCWCGHEHDWRCPPDAEFRCDACTGDSGGS
jgi:excisionase family DNA binding protein